MNERMLSSALSLPRTMHFSVECLARGWSVTEPLHVRRSVCGWLAAWVCEARKRVRLSVCQKTPNRPWPVCSSGLVGWTGPAGTVDHCALS